MSPATDERRQGPDRRRGARGGRRPADPNGFSPLILVADDNADSSSRCEAILAKLRFAVAPARSADEAMRVMQALRPDLVVSHLSDEHALRRQMDSDPKVAAVPFLS